MDLTCWNECVKALRDEISQQQFNMWIRPLQAQIKESELFLLAPNNFVLDYIKVNFLGRINELIGETSDAGISIKLMVGNKSSDERSANGDMRRDRPYTSEGAVAPGSAKYRNYLNAVFTFNNFVEGKSNQLARAAAWQIANNAGKDYNPLFIYGGVGLGKTHLMHAIGNMILQHKPDAKVLYLHSERFVADMVRALQNGTINDFKKHYRSLDALLIDDIQFLANKERTQEEFFHTFNALLELQQQMVMTCDRYPKEITGLEERLKSRFGWGLTVAVEPPELETRVAILLSKAEQSRINLPHEVAFFVAKHVQSNIRELEGALKRIIANAHFTGQGITLDFAKEALKDILALRARLVTIDNIQKTVAEYFKIKLNDLLSKNRTRNIARVRQIAMALAKELTNHSLPQIAEAFGGRDHTTVLHACKKVKELIAQDLNIAEDYRNLLRILST